MVGHCEMSRNAWPLVTMMRHMNSLRHTYTGCSCLRACVTVHNSTLPRGCAPFDTLRIIHLRTRIPPRFCPDVPNHFPRRAQPPCARRACVRTRA